MRRKGRKTISAAGGRRMTLAVQQPCAGGCSSARCMKRMESMRLENASDEALSRRDHEISAAASSCHTLASRSGVFLVMTTLDDSSRWMWLAKRVLKVQS